MCAHRHITLSYGDLFTRRSTASTLAMRTHGYDILQVESHRMAITIKVPFNLLILRNMLKEDTYR